MGIYEITNKTFMYSRNRNEIFPNFEKWCKKVNRQTKVNGNSFDKPVSRPTRKRGFRPECPTGNVSTRWTNLEGFQCPLRNGRILETLFPIKILIYIHSVLNNIIWFPLTNIFIPGIIDFNFIHLKWNTVVLWYGPEGDCSVF